MDDGAMRVAVVEVDPVAAAAQASGQQAGCDTCAVQAALSLAYPELLLPALIDHGSVTVPA